MAVNDVTIFRDPDTGDVGLKDKSSGNKFLWSSDRQEWFLEDSSGERPVGGPKGAQNVSVTDYAVETKDGNRRLLVETSSDFRFRESVSDTTGRINDIKYSPDGNYFLVGTSQEGLIYNKNDLNLQKTLTNPGGSVTSVEWTNQNEPILFTFNDNNTVYFYDENFNLDYTIDSFSGNPTGGDVNRKNEKLVVGDTSGIVTIYNYNSSIGQYEFEADYDVSATSAAFDTVEWNENTGYFAAYEGSDTVYIYDGNFNLIDQLSNNPTDKYISGDLTWREDDYLIVAGHGQSGGDGSLKLYDDSFTLVSQVDSVSMSTTWNNLAYSSKKELVAVGGGEGEYPIKLYDKDLSFIRDITSGGATDIINAVEFSNNSDQLSNGSEDTNVRVYEVLRNKVNIASDNPDYFETTIVNSGDWIVEIESTDATLNSLVGSEPKIIDQWGEATIKKTGSSEYLVEGNIYKETGDGFTQSL